VLTNSGLASSSPVCLTGNHCHHRAATTYVSPSIMYLTACSQNSNYGNNLFVLLVAYLFREMEKLSVF
jgi:hypothetical protein